MVSTATSASQVRGPVAAARSSHSQNVAQSPVTTSTAMVAPRGMPAAMATSGHTTAARAKRIRNTDKGLSSSSGAPRVNHDRVLGKRRCWTVVDARGPLVTA
jgi:hypothetical protein